jgi:hypothetical protein
MTWTRSSGVVPGVVPGAGLAFLFDPRDGEGEADALWSAVARVRGVRSVEDHLERHVAPAPELGLQGGPVAWALASSSSRSAGPGRPGARGCGRRHRRGERPAPAQPPIGQPDARQRRLARPCRHQPPDKGSHRPRRRRRGASRRQSLRRPSAATDRRRPAAHASGRRTRRDLRAGRAPTRSDGLSRPPCSAGESTDKFATARVSHRRLRRPAVLRRADRGDGARRSPLARRGGDTHGARHLVGVQGRGTCGAPFPRDLSARLPGR